MRSQTAPPVDATLPLLKAAPLGLQHTLAIFAGTIAVPLIVAEALGLLPADKTLLIQAALLMSGLGTLLQSAGLGPVGARLPLVLGASFAYVGIAIAIGGSFGLDAVFGGALVAGLVLILAGGLIKRLRFLFPPLVSGLYILLIGLILLPVGFELACGGAGAPDFGAPKHILLAGLALGTALVMHQFGKGFLSMMAILIAMATGCVAAFFLGWMEPSPAASVAWVSPPALFPFGLRFETAAVLSFVLISITVIAETIGDISGATIAGLDREPADREIAGGVMGVGCGSAVGAAFGCLPLVTYSQNVGLIALTGVASRPVVSLAGLFLIVAGLFPKLAAVIGAMPVAVLGGVSIMMFGSVAAAGLKMLARVDLNSRNMLIIGLTLATGVGLPEQTGLLERLPEQLRFVMETGLVPAALLAIALNLALPGRTP